MLFIYYKWIKSLHSNHRPTNSLDQKC